MLKRLFYSYYYYLFKFSQIFDDNDSSHIWASMIIWGSIGNISIFMLIVLLKTLNIFITFTFVFNAMFPFWIIGLITGIFFVYENKTFKSLDKRYKNSKHLVLKSFLAFFCFFLTFIFTFITMSMVNN